MSRRWLKCRLPHPGASPVRQNRRARGVYRHQVRPRTNAEAAASQAGASGGESSTSPASSDTSAVASSTIGAAAIIRCSRAASSASVISLSRFVIASAERSLRHHVHHLVAARLELLDQFRQRFGGVSLEIVHQDDAHAVFSSWLITDLITSSGLCSLKSRESMSVENTPILRSAKYDKSWGGCCRTGKRKNGATFPSRRRPCAPR